MISQIEHHIKHQEFDAALELVPLLQQAFADQDELVNVIKLLQENLGARSHESMETLRYLKHVIVG